MYEYEYDPACSGPPCAPGRWRRRSAGGARRRAASWRCALSWRRRGSSWRTRRSCGRRRSAAPARPPPRTPSGGRR
eukprot:1194631-Prorocentrum_minimum.AAC.3